MNCGTINEAIIKSVVGCSGKSLPRGFSENPACNRAGFSFPEPGIVDR